MKPGALTLLAVTSCFLLLSGCADLKPYRIVLIDTECKAGADGRIPPECETSIREKAGEDYDLFFVEFDDQGLQYPSEFFEPKQRKHLTEISTGCDGKPLGDRFNPPASFQISLVLQCLQHLVQDGRYKGLSVVVYAHGWQHNARHDDANVREFRKLLRTTAIIERAQKSGYRVVGIYVGWRGLSTPVPLLTQLTFWSRKTAATHIALGSSRELFSRLIGFRCSANSDGDSSAGCDADLDRSTNGNDTPRRPRVRMILIGHSFGGLILYNAVSGYLTERLTRGTDAGGEPQRVLRYGDLIVLINPAFEATRYTPLHRIAAQRENPREYQAPIFVAITSRADHATKFFFPLGRTTSSSLQRYASDEELLANRNTIGHVPEYLTHRLSTCTNPSECPPDMTARCEGWADPGTRPEKDQEAQAAMNLSIEADNAAAYLVAYDPGKPRYFCGGALLTAEGEPRNTPIWNILADPGVMSEHSDLGNPVLSSFVRQIYHDTIAHRIVR